MEKKESRIDGFIALLESYVRRGERGPLAELRRAFSRTTEHRSWPYLAQWCDLTNETERIIWQTIGAGLATLGQSEQEGNLGDTMRRLAIGSRKDTENQNMALKSFEGRFRRLLTCRTVAEVCERLPPIIRACKNKGVGINFRQLYWDLVSWGRSADRAERVKLEWARAYWGE